MDIREKTGISFGPIEAYGKLEINDFLWGGSLANVLQLGSGITSESIGVSLDDRQDIVLTIGNTGDQIKLDRAATGNLNYGVENVQFADGSSSDAAAISQPRLALFLGSTARAAGPTFSGSVDAATKTSGACSCSVPGHTCDVWRSEPATSQTGPVRSRHDGIRTL